MPLILGHPFLATGRTLIDVEKGELCMRVNKEKVFFKVFKPMRVPTSEDKEQCSRIDVIDEKVDKACVQSLEPNLRNYMEHAVHFERWPPDKVASKLRTVDICYEGGGCTTSSKASKDGCKGSLKPP